MRPVSAVRVALLAIGFAMTTSLAGLAVAPVLGSAGSMTSAAGAALDTDGDGLSDVFEQRYGLDPTTSDTDADGLLDPAEDPDHDGLSNLGEQNIGTNPLVRDTDGDGILDGNDDANRDGVDDWRQQDARAVPDHLTPPLTKANNDDRCYKPGVGSTGVCVGDPTGAMHIVIYGDSHAGQWIPALDTYAKQHQWHLADIAKSGCPSVHLAVWPDAAGNTACRDWRKDTEQQLQSDPPDLVIISNYSHYGASAAQWRVGLKKLITALPPSSRVMVLADTPLFPHRVPACLKDHRKDMGLCEVPRSVGLSVSHDRVESSVARANGATFASMNPWVCPYQLCPVIVGHLLVWRDSNHLTVTYSRQLAPALGALAAAALRGTP